MPKELLTNKMLLIFLGVIAIVSLIWISYSATQSITPVPSPTPTVLKPKTATLVPPITDKPVSGQIIIKFKPQYTKEQIAAHLQKYHANSIKTIEGINQTVVKVPAGREDAILQQLQSDPYVETSQRDYTTHAFFAPNDQGFRLQYGLSNSGQSIQGVNGTAKDDIHAEKAWDVTRGDGVKVAILDTGVNLNHPDLAGKIVGQKSFVSNTVEDGNGHGTHVAGILAADTNNGIGIAGTCPDCHLLIGKVLNDLGSGTTSNATAGIIWAADNGAKVINLSLGTTDEQTASLYEQAVSYAIRKGAVVVAAAGNDGNTQFNYPAAVPGVISVAGTDNNDKKASWSNFGSWVELAAPGKNILSTGPTHAFELEPSGYDTTSPYMYMSGTSMATPFVAGVAALVATTPFGTTPQAITNRLLATADKISGTGSFWRYGRVNAALAVGPAPTEKPVVSTTITPTLYCVGGNGKPPCATIPADVTLTSPATGGTSPSPSTIVNNPAVSSANPTSSVSQTSPSPSITSVPTGTPGTSRSCFTITSIFYDLNQTTQLDVSTHSHHAKSHHKVRGHGQNGNGLLSRFFAFLLQLLQLLFQCTLPPATGTTTPSQTPSPTTSGKPTTTQKPTTPPVTSSSCTNPKYTIQQDSNNPQNGITIGKFYIDTDTWNAANYHLAQTMYVCDYNNWYVVANMNDTGDGAVKTYPDVHEDFTNSPKISSFNTITSSYAHVAPSAGNWDFAYDIWINGVASSGSTELMIWTQAMGKQADAIKSYPSLGTVTLNGITYNVHHNGKGYIALEMLPYKASETINLKEVFTYIISKGLIPSGSTLGAIDYGVEIVSTNGTNQTFKVTNFSLSTN